MLQIAIIEDEADLAQQTKDNVVRYLNEHGLEGNIAVFNDGMDIAENYKPIWDIIKGIGFENCTYQLPKESISYCIDCDGLLCCIFHIAVRKQR